MPAVKVYSVVILEERRKSGPSGPAWGAAEARLRQLTSRAACSDPTNFGD